MTTRTFRRGRMLRALCSGALALGLTSAPHAAPLCPDRPIKVGLFEAGYYYKNGTGVDQDVIDEWRRRSKCSFDTAEYPRSRIFALMAEGKLDIATAGITTPEREKTYWLVKYGMTKYYALLTPSVPASVRSMEDFVRGPQHLHWSTVRGLVWGSYFQPMYDELTRQGRMEFSSSSRAHYEMLREGRFAGMLDPPLVYRQVLKELGLQDKVVVADWDKFPRPVNFMLSRLTFSEAQANDWRELTNGMIADGTMRRILGKYLGGEELESALP